MIKWVKIFLFAVFAICFGMASASEPQQTVADVKTELISGMEKDGFLSKKMAGEVAQKYVTEKDKTSVIKIINANKAQIEQKQIAVKAKDTIKWADYLSWLNFLKVVGIIILLIGFSKLIGKIMKGLWVFIAAVPVIIYQLVFIIGGLIGILRPDLISQSQYFYVALFSAFANIIVLGWIIETHEELKKFVAKLFNLGIPVSCVISFYGMLYFGALAFGYESSIFGFFAAICLSGVFSFGMYYSPGVLFLDFKENMMSVVVFGHMLVLAAYVFFFKDMPQSIYFDAGIQYYCTIAMCVGLLVGASPFYKKESAIGYTVIFIALFFAAGYGYFFYDVKVIASIIFVFFVLFMLEWIGYIGYHAGAIAGSAIVGGSLYGAAMLLEKYGSMLVLTMNQ